MLTKPFAVLLLLGLVACGHKTTVTTQSAGESATMVPGAAVLVPAGTTFYGKLQGPISSKGKDGDTFSLAQTDTFLHKNAALHGTVVDGHIENVRAAGPARKPSMTIVFDDITMPDGAKSPIAVKLLSLGAFEPKSHHLRTLGMMIGGAVAGHAAAAKLGKKHGGLLGAAGGYALSQELKTDITVPAGSVLELQFTRPVTGTH
ncbi:MAG: hypothetical protein M3Y21_12385 [Candidatus Eremiobacteraeota bacterium]|nr:hypothetical protein [Candidatus Eremiobacteraeota bacterium]